MKREDLPPEKQKEYDAIIEKIEKELEAIPPIPPGVLSCELGNRPFQEIANKYLPKLQYLLKNDEK
ncbi:MAG: hypothetical protein J1E64_14975 [Acetatifactor sp.]|nr:hypothetical protein [Acetatifactor sp.]